MHVLILSGPVGVGKSSTATAISKILADHSIASAVVDLDDLRDVRPWSDKDPFFMSLGYKNLAAIWRNYEDAGIHYLMIPNVVEHRGHVSDLEHAVPGADIRVVRLKAAVEILHERLKRRHEDGEELQWHLNRATELANQLEKEPIEDFAVDTDKKSVHEVAGEVLSRIAWLSK